jgi:hypothetical protein
LSISKQAALPSSGYSSSEAFQVFSSGDQCFKERFTTKVSSQTAYDAPVWEHNSTAEERVSRVR